MSIDKQTESTQNHSDEEVAPAKSRWWVSFLLTLLVFFPAMLMGYWTWNHAVNTPVWDDWERVPLLQKSVDGTLDFKFLYSPHIDHRILIPRLITLGLNGITNGDLRAEMAVSFIFFLAGAIALFILLRKTFAGSSWVWMVALISNTIIFSPIQFQNFLWAIQVAMLIPLGCLGLLVLAMQSRMRWWVKLIIASTLALIGMHSFGHGVILWPVTICLGLLLKDFGSVKQRLLFVLISLLIAGGSIYFYQTWHNKTTSYHSYGQEVGEKPIGTVMLEEFGKLFSGNQPDENAEESKLDLDLDKVSKWGLTVLGNPLARMFPNPWNAARNAGRTIAWMVGICVIFLFFWSRRPRHWNAMLPWVAVAFYGVSAAIIMSVARSSLPVERGMMSRYYSVTMFALAGGMVVAGYIGYHWISGMKSHRRQEIWTRVFFGAAIAFLALQAAGPWADGYYKMRDWKAARLQAKAALMFMEHNPPEMTARIDLKIEKASEFARFLNEQGWMNPPIFEEMGFNEFKQSDPDPLDTKRANFEKCIIYNKDHLTLRGYALLRAPDRIADGILLAWRLPGEEEWKPIEFVEMQPIYLQPSWGIDKEFGHTKTLTKPRSYARWEKTIKTDGLPQEKIELTAYAVDVDKMRVQKYINNLEIDLGNDPVGTDYMKEESSEN